MSAAVNYCDLLIQRIKDHIPVNENEVEFVQNLFVEEHFNKNEVVLKEGVVCKKLYFIANGIVRFSKLDEGEERTFVFRSEGAFCNDMSDLRNNIGSCFSASPNTTLPLI